MQEETMSIIIYPNKKLREKCENSITIHNIDSISSPLVDMKTLVEEQNALGIAANQCGYNFRSIIVRIDDSLVIMLNPRILEAKGNIFNKEGCLSFPGVFVNISRPKTITVEWEDIKFKTHKEDFFNTSAMIIQHEVDHINGITIFQRAGKTTKALIIKDLKKAKNTEKRKKKTAIREALLMRKMKELDRKTKILSKTKRAKRDKKKDSKSG